MACKTDHSIKKNAHRHVHSRYLLKLDLLNFLILLPLKYFGRIGTDKHHDTSNLNNLHLSVEREHLLSTNLKRINKEEFSAVRYAVWI